MVLFQGNLAVHLFINFLDSTLSKIERFFALFAGILIMIMMILVCTEVLGRTIFNSPIHGAIDILEQLMVAIVTLGISYGQSNFCNVRMTIICDHFKKRKHWLNEILVLSIATYVTTILSIGSYWNMQRSLNNGGDTPELGIPLWPAIATVTIALGLLSLRLFTQWLESIRILFSKSDESNIFTAAAIKAEHNPEE